MLILCESVSLLVILNIRAVAVSILKTRSERTSVQIRRILTKSILVLCGERMFDTTRFCVAKDSFVFMFVFVLSGRKSDPYTLSIECYIITISPYP